jgi:hypothetical protein
LELLADEVLDQVVVYVLVMDIVGLVLFGSMWVRCCCLVWFGDVSFSTTMAMAASLKVMDIFFTTFEESSIFVLFVIL